MACSCCMNTFPGKNGRSKNNSTISGSSSLHHRLTTINNWQTGNHSNDNQSNANNANNGTRKLRYTNSTESFKEIPLSVTLMSYLGLFIIFFIGYVKEFFSKFLPSLNPTPESNRNGYAPLYSSYASFITRNGYRLIRDCCCRPICSVPGVDLVIKDRITTDNGFTFKFTGTYSKCLNVGSYNYLGFAENEGSCAAASQKAILEMGIGIGSPRQELGTLTIHKELERYVAHFVGTEDAITFGMGFATNSLNLPSLISKGCLVMSDEKNHASIILGLRLSGATVRVFKHNDMEDLEEKLKDGVINGQPRTFRPYRKIFIVVEGIYSMEGSIVNLPEIIALKKKYKAFLYLDEAHSIGALGPNGRGAVDYYGCDPRDVDMLMGTFSKSFASSGGYIAGSRKLVNHLRVHSQATCYAMSMSPPVAQQIISAMTIIMGKDGTDQGKKRLDQLLRNTRYFRQKLRQLGLVVYGNDDSPVVPVILFMPAKMPATSRELLKRGIASVMVGYPAVRLSEGRSRFCISASHTKEMLDKAIEAIAEVTELLHLNYSRLPSSETNRPIIYEELLNLEVD